MSCGVAANVYRYGQACNVGGIGENAYLQGCCRAAETAGADAELVDFFQQFFLQLGYVRLFAHTADRSEKGFLAEEGCPFHCSADADSHDDGWAGVSASVENGVDDKLLDSFHACTGRKHLESALVFAAEPLWCYGDVELISRYDFVVNDGWCVVCCVHTVYRVFYNRLAQIAVCIALAARLG